MKQSELKVERIFVYSDGTEKMESELSYEELKNVRKKIEEQFIKGFNLEVKF